MLAFTLWLIASLAALTGTVRAYVAADADLAFSAYNVAFYTSSGSGSTKVYYYKPSTASSSNTGFWTFLEEIEMVADVYDRTRAAGTATILGNLCNGFISKHGSSWSSNLYNDDLEWGCIAMCRAYLATGNTAFRDCAKTNFDTVWARGWTTELGGGILWCMDSGVTRQKNACSNGPAIIASCYLSQILGDSSYLTKAQQIYAWERAHLFNPSVGAVADSQVVSTGAVNTAWIFTYNQGTFIGGANALYKATGTQSYYQDALLTTLCTKNLLCNGSGIFPVSTDDGGDGATFNGIGFRWVARFVNDQNLWGDFYPWLKANADAAWNLRRTGDNLSWCNWTTATATGTRYSNGCAGSVVALQVVPPLNPSLIIPAAPTGVSVAMVDGTASLAWSPTTNASAYNVKRATNSGGPYTTVGSGVSTTSYRDNGLALTGKYFYVVSSLGTGGEGANSVEAQASDSYQQWVLQNGMTPGAVGSGFADVVAGMSMPNGLRYGVPTGLAITSGPAASTVTFDLRSDPALSAVLWVSTDLLSWNVSNAPAAVATDQSGVAQGFTRFVFRDVATQAPAKFYRLQLSR